MVIDFHTNLGCESDILTEAENLLREMDSAGVDMAVICPAGRYLAIYNHDGNNAIAKVVEKHPDRFVGFGCASPWYGDEAVAEVERFRDLGLKGLKVQSFIQGFMLCDHMIDPVLTACQKHDLPVLVHTGTPVSAMPFQLRELAMRFPEVTFIMGHMGFPDAWFDVTPAADGLENIYFEWSYNMPFTIFDAVEKYGDQRMLFGSDWPYCREKLEKKKAFWLPDEKTQNRMLGGNAARILGIGEDML